MNRYESLLNVSGNIRTITIFWSTFSMIIKYVNDFVCSVKKKGSHLRLMLHGVIFESK